MCNAIYKGSEMKAKFMLLGVQEMQLEMQLPEAIDQVGQDDCVQVAKLLEKGKYYQLYEPI